MAWSAAQPRWRAWQWATWLGATAAAVLIVGVVSVFLFEFVDVCGAFDNPIGSEVRELQGLLAVLVLVGVGGWALGAALTGRWWRRAAFSAAATVALPVGLVVTHLTVASWASVGFCRM